MAIIHVSHGRLAGCPDRGAPSARVSHARCGVGGRCDATVSKPRASLRLIQTARIGGSVAEVETRSRHNDAHVLWVAGEGVAIPLVVGGPSDAAELEGILDIAAGPVGRMIGRSGAGGHAPRLRVTDRPLYDP